MRVLTQEDIAPAVIGGTILGGGGGGHVAAGLDFADAALAAGEIRMLTVDELPADTLVAICAGVGAPGAPDAQLSNADFHMSTDYLNAELIKRGSRTVGAVATNENGAMGTVNGWLQAATTGLPLLDCPCNGRAHPTGIMGALGLHRDPTYTSMAGFAGGPESEHSQGIVLGSLNTTSRAMRSLSVVSGGLIAVTRNPISVDFLAQQGAPGAITQAIAVGQAHASGGVDAVTRLLGGRVIGHGPVQNLMISQVSGFDVGSLHIDGVDLTFVNEYMSAIADNTEVAQFPDLIMTFDGITGDPVVSAHLSEGLDVVTVVVPRSSLLLSSTMHMPELMEPVAALLAGDEVNAG